MINFGEVQRAQLAKSTLLTSTLVPLASFQISQGLFRCYREVEKATGSYRTYSILGKIAALDPEFVMEDLPLAELQPRFLHFQ